MVFNGLKGADLVVFNYLLQVGDQPIRIRDIERVAPYHYNTIKLSINRLEEWRCIDRDRPGPGKPYTYKVLDEVRR